jgi:hypothetical protein
MLAHAEVLRSSMLLFLKHSRLGPSLQTDLLTYIRPDRNQTDQDLDDLVSRVRAASGRCEAIYSPTGQSKNQ